MGRILAIDYGGKRTGLAMTDPFQISINPLPTIATSEFEKMLNHYLSNGEVSDVVFGLPRHSDGNLTKIGDLVIKEIDIFSKKYSEIRFHTIDESFTSKRAREMMLHLGTKKKQRAKKSNVDMMSAVIILKDFRDQL